MKQIEQDILELKEGIIFQQVNCMGVMGSGIALAIKNKWPHVYDKYRQFWEQATDNGQNKWQALGSYQITELNPGKLYLVNLFGQYDYGVNDGRKTEYSAVFTALNLFCVHARHSKDLHSLEQFVPFKMCSDRAGGDWEIIKDIIQKTLGDDVTICKKPE